jgi:hypothetical protein
MACRGMVVVRGCQAMMEFWDVTYDQLTLSCPPFF